MSETDPTPKAWWRLSIYETCDPCVTVREEEASFWRDEGLTVIELGDIAAERSRIASLLRARGLEELARMVEGGE